MTMIAARVNNGATSHRRGKSGTTSTSPPRFLRTLLAVLTLLLVSFASFYVGVLTGMHLSNNENNDPVGGGDDGGGEGGDVIIPRPKYYYDEGAGVSNVDFDRRVSEEVERRLASMTTVHDGRRIRGRKETMAVVAMADAIKEDDRGGDEGEEREEDEEDGVMNGDGRKGDVVDRGGRGRDGVDDESRRRFPSTISKIATGASLIRKNDFLSLFDYGIPRPPSKRLDESDPGKDEVLLLYGGTRSLPDNGSDAATVYVDGGGERIPPRMSAADATRNCGGLNVIYVESQDSEFDLCTAIVGNFESYHVQRWMRTDPDDPNSGLDAAFPLTPVGRGLQTNGQDKFSAPEDKYALRNQALLETYFVRLGGTIDKLGPMAEACAGNDNTVIVMVCNTGQSDLLINFICSARSRGFGDIVNQKVLVFATDEGVLKIARGLGLNTFYDEVIFKDMPEREARVYGDQAFTQMMYAKVVTVQLINRIGYDVLFQDVDLVWYKNPLTFFHDKTSPMYAFDILFQDDGARTTRYAPYSANTGFYYVRNNDKTKFLFRSLLFLGDMVLSMTSHQQALGALLDEHSSLTGLRVKTLSAYDFPGGYHYHRKKEIPVMKDIVKGNHVPYLFHMSWTTNRENKLVFLKQMGLWYTKKECESGGGVKVAEEANDTGGFDLACCSAEPLITCYYRDKPSVEECKHVKVPSIDRGQKGKSFW
ncbi:hypothetical protein ACHAXA_010524 [Cyclostephanos tholiformis]|uniref:Nucleotide-diphospho-sugar transferase domain-containing protein n=1 Tax=Cyclostephanos tholiformis TaxID=382380 RepID=A0ABD3SPT0_9STRA